LGLSVSGTSESSSAAAVLQLPISFAQIRIHELAPKIEAACDSTLPVGDVTRSPHSRSAADFPRLAKFRPRRR